MTQEKEYGREIWEKDTIIKDMVHGYIKVPKPIMREIVDSEQFQRLKDIEQTGMEALYPSATHKRFTHSLGVYFLAKKAFKEFRNNVSVSYPETYGVLLHEKVQEYEQVWSRWGLLFQLAALLHDCGHSPFSHTLEFIYDLPEDESGKELDKKLLKGMDKEFIKDFKRGEDQHYGKAHERMSALYIKTAEYSGLRLKIEKLLKSYVQAYGLGDVYDNPQIMDDDIEFMIRMIIGCPYDYTKKEKYRQGELLYAISDRENWYLELQLRNCIISMLNSKLDVDNLDYVVRDSKFSGYANHTVDIERLLSSFTIIRGFQVENMEITDQDNFDYCINLKSFKGKMFKGRLTGASHILCRNRNITAHGRISLTNQSPKTGADQRIYQTAEDFSAKLVFEGNRDAQLEITPPMGNNQEYAYLHFKGNMAGKLTGIVFANDSVSNEESSVWSQNGEKRIFFAYEQKCMSVLMSSIYNSDFEKKWIYAHHISTFTNEFLYIYLLEKYAEYVVRNKQEELKEDLSELLDIIEIQPISDKKISNRNRIILNDLKNNLQAKENDSDIYDVIYSEDSNDLAATNICVRRILQLCNGLAYQKEEYADIIYEKLKECCLTPHSLSCLKPQTAKHMQAVYEKHKGILTTEMQAFSDILAMYDVYMVDGMAFYKTSDRDLLAAYKNLYTKIVRGRVKNSEKYSEFRESYEELTQRRYLKCLWKSQPEFDYYFSDWTEDEIEKVKGLLRPSAAPKGCDYMVLSDNIDLSKLSTFAREFWEELKNEYQMERFVCVPQKIWTKEFVDQDTYMKRGNRVLRIKDIKLFNDDRQEHNFFYFYYWQSEQKDIDVFKLLDWLKGKI